MELAKQGIAELKKSCDTVLVILNDKLREVFGNLSIRNAFAQADNVLTTGAKGIAEIITVPGYVNVDFEDVKTVMSQSGTAVMGTAQAEGEGRALRAAEEALNSPLLNEKDIHGAQKVLLSIISGEEAELQMDELSEITDYITDMAGDDAEVIFGHGIDSELGESIRVTVIATGFDQKAALEQIKNKPKVIDLESSKPVKKPSPQISMFDLDDIEQQPAEVAREIPRTYVFEKPGVAEREEPGLSEHKVGVDEQEEVLNEIVKPEVGTFEEDGDKALERKKEMLAKQARERVEKLRKIKKVPFADEDFKEKYEKPAYLRRNITLNDTPNSWDENISRYNLNDDNHIVGNNKFLHDNVD
jgi:cell division protein FtsZ